MSLKGQIQSLIYWIENNTEYDLCEEDAKNLCKDLEIIKKNAAELQAELEARDKLISEYQEQHRIESGQIVDLCNEIKRLNVELHCMRHEVYEYAENERLQKEIERLKGLIEEMADFVIHAQHDAGCNYPYGQNYGCKCGLLGLQKKLKGQDK